jgi:hypothetical protein
MASSSSSPLARTVSKSSVSFISNSSESESKLYYLSLSLSLWVPNKISTSSSSLYLGWFSPSEFSSSSELYFPSAYLIIVLSIDSYSDWDSESLSDTGSRLLITAQFSRSVVSTSSTLSFRYNFNRYSFGIFLRSLIKRVSNISPQF